MVNELLKNHKTGKCVSVILFCILYQCLTDDGLGRVISAVYYKKRMLKHVRQLSQLHTTALAGKLMAAGHTLTALLVTCLVTPFQ